MRRVWILAVIAGAFAMCAEASAQTAKPVDPRAAAAADTSLRVIVSLQARRVWVVSGTRDTLLDAPVAIGSGKTLRTSTQKWTFTTPRGVHTVLSKEEDPIWIRPDWAYVEVARKLGLHLTWLEDGKPAVLTDGRVLEIRDHVAGLVDDSGGFAMLPTDEELVFGSVLYVPPTHTDNRRVPGQLGRYRLNIGNGIGLHGTPDSSWSGVR